MTQAIDPIRLKAAAEHLEWVLRQYPESEDVQNLLHALLPMIDEAKAMRVREPVERRSIPGGYNFGKGAFTPYSNPSVEEAYVAFSTEMRGGLTEQERRIVSSIGAAASGEQP